MRPMADAWALFGSDDDEGDGAGDVSSDAYAGNKRQRAVDGAGARDTYGGGDGGGFGAPRGGKAAATTAAEHAYFAMSRRLWPSEALGPSSSIGAANLSCYLAELVADAGRRVPGIATRLRGFKPEGSAAAAALGASGTAAGVGDWATTAREATECLDAHSRQLDVGNWPDECWQESHVFAIGLYIAAALCAREARPSTTAATQSDRSAGGGVEVLTTLNAQQADGPAIKLGRMVNPEP